MTSRSKGVENFDDSTKDLVIKCETMGGGGRGVKNCPILCDVIYGRPQSIVQRSKIIEEDCILFSFHGDETRDPKKGS